MTAGTRRWSRVAVAAALTASLSMSAQQVAVGAGNVTGAAPTALQTGSWLDRPARVALDLSDHFGPIGAVSANGYGGSASGPMRAPKGQSPATIPAARGKNERRPYQRTESIEYLSPVIGYYLSDNTRPGVCDSIERLGCVLFETAPGERFVEIQVADSRSDPVVAVVETLNVVGSVGTHTICSATEEPIELDPFRPRRASGVFAIRVYIYAGSCSDAAATVPTQGVVEATFYKKRPSAKN